MTLTNAMRARLLNALYGDVPVAPAATLYVALSTTLPDMAGDNFTRPSGNAYADVAVTNNATNWPSATSADPAVQENGEEIAFPNPTGSWGTVGYWGVSESDGGTVVDWAPLDNPVAIDADSAPVRFLAGALTTELRSPA